MAQIPFRWPRVTSYETEDFVTSAANAHAVHFIENWPDGTSYIGLLDGPMGSGKTHLAHIWAERLDAVFLPGGSLGTIDSSTLWSHAPAAILEDIDSVDEAALFHLVRHAESQHLPLLLTASLPAKQLAIKLADLRSRLHAAPHASILAPDEELLHLFFVKHFADQQWQVSDQVLQYLLKRMERSFASARAIVAKMEQQLTENNKPITIATIKALGIADLHKNS